MSAPPCITCGGALVAICSNTFSTLVGYFGRQPCGEVHDDNCRCRAVKCENGHVTAVHTRSSCTACDWRGKVVCFCHKGPKLDAWPDLPVVKGLWRQYL